jgi:hypothetical protein
MTNFAFEEISEDQLKAELKTSTSRSKNKKFDDTDRSQTGWFRLPHLMGFCTVPTHDELQKLICETSEDARQWREQKYPNRMTYFIDPYHVCRDCYIASADVDCRNKELPPIEFSGGVDAS